MEFKEGKKMTFFNAIMQTKPKRKKDAQPHMSTNWFNNILIVGWYFPLGTFSNESNQFWCVKNYNDKNK